MFTGLVLGQGRVRAIEARGDQVRLVVAPLFALDDIVIGESIAVNGACLTVESASGGAFSVYASAETTSRTSLGALRPGGVVNLERALKLSDRLGGHLVSGHVDCPGHGGRGPGPRANRASTAWNFRPIRGRSSSRRARSAWTG